MLGISVKALWNYENNKREVGANLLIKLIELSREKKIIFDPSWLLLGPGTNIAAPSTGVNFQVEGKQMELLLDQAERIIKEAQGIVERLRKINPSVSHPQKVIEEVKR